MTTLVPGVRGTEVTHLQNNLYLLRYDVYGTSVYDTYTVAAVQAFRSDYWGDPGGEECEPYTFDAITTTAASQRADAEAPPDPHDATTPSAPAQDSTTSSSGVTTPAIVNKNGTVVAHVNPRVVYREGDYTPFKEMGLVYDGLRLEFPVIAQELDVAVDALATVANQLGGVTIAVGLDAEIAAVFGLTVGAGVYASSTGEYGLYKSLGVDWGFVFEAAIGAGVTIMNGGPDAFGGPALAVKVSADIGIGASGAILYSPGGDHLCIGACFEVSLGIGAGVYGSVTNTWLEPGNN
jgi:hypothetical protein